MKKKLLYTGGVLSLLFTCLHLLFPKMFDWGHSLTCLIPANRAVYLTLYIATTFILAMSVVICFVLARQKSISLAETNCTIHVCWFLCDQDYCWAALFWCY